MSESASSNGITRTPEGLLIELHDDYVIIDEMPKQSEIVALDNNGAAVTVKVTKWNNQYMLRPVGECAMPVRIAVSVRSDLILPCLV